jgi:hypothetical protein
VQARFAAVLIQRRKLYPSVFRSVLSDVQAVRNVADYVERGVTNREAVVVVCYTREFTRVIQSTVEAT